MKHRIIELPYDHCEVVLLSIVRDETDGEDYVEIVAWHQSAEGLDYYQRETVSCASIERCERFINDYSEQSALDFVESYNFDYGN